MPMTFTHETTPGGRRYVRVVSSGEIVKEDTGPLLSLITSGQAASEAGILAVVEPGTKYAPEARQALTVVGADSQGLRPWVAVVVGNAPLRVMLSFVIRLSGAGKVTRFFGDEAQARAWLLSVLDSP